MVNQHYLIVTLLAVVLLCCTYGAANEADDASEPGDITITLDIDFERVSDHAEISFSPIENETILLPEDASIIGPVDYHLLSDGKYLLVDRGGNKVIVFENGRFIFRLGSIGRGPGEYQEIVDFSIGNQRTLLLLVDDGTKLLEFSPNEIFLNEKRLQERCKSFYATNNELWSRPIDADRDRKTYIRHSQGDKSLKIEIPSPIITIPVQESNFSRTSDGSIIYFESFNNCIYEVSTDRSVPIYCFNYGKLTYANLADGEDDVSKFMSIRKSGIVRIVDYQKVSDRYSSFVFSIEKIDDIKFYISLHDKSEGDFEIKHVKSAEIGKPIFHNVPGPFVFLKRADIGDSEVITLTKVDPLEIFR